VSRELQATLKHSAVYGVAAVLNRGAAFAIIPIYTKNLSTADYGILGLIVVASEIIGTVLGMGLGLSMSRIYFDYKEERDRGEVVTTALLTFCLAALAFLVPYSFFSEQAAELLLQESGRGKLLMLGTTGLLLNSAFTLGLQYLRVIQNSKAVLAISTVRSILYLGLSALFVAGLDMGIDGAVTGVLITNGTVATLLIGSILWQHGVRLSRTKLKAMLSFGLPVLPGSFAEFGIVFLDRYLVLQFVSMSAAGVYFLGLRLGSLLYALLIVPFGQIYIARRLKALGDEDKDEDASHIFTLFFLLICGASLGLALFAPEIVQLIGTAEYTQASSVIPLIALVQVLASMLLITQLGMFYRKLSGRLMSTSLAMLLVHLPLCYVLVSNFGLIGAPIALCASTFVKLLVTIFLARNLNGPRPEWRRLFGVLGTAAFFYALGLLAPSEPYGVSLGIRATLCIAFAMVMVNSPLLEVSERQALFSRVSTLFRTGRIR